MRKLLLSRFLIIILWFCHWSLQLTVWVVSMISAAWIFLRCFLASGLCIHSFGLSDWQFPLKVHLSTRWSCNNLAGSWQCEMKFTDHCSGLKGSILLWPWIASAESENRTTNPRTRDTTGDNKFLGTNCTWILLAVRPPELLTYLVWESKQVKKR